MKILAFFFHFPPISGGGSVVSFEIVNNLLSLGHEVTVLTPDLDWDGKKYEPDTSNMKIIRVDTPARSNLKLAARLCKKNLMVAGDRLCKEENFDLIFTIFHPFHLVSNAAVFCAKKNRIPSVIKVDDAVYEKSHGLKSIQRFIEKKISAKSLKNSTEILVLNENMKITVSKTYNIPTNKISIMPNGIDISSFNNKISSREKRIIFSGVMYYHRGLDVLLDAAKDIISSVPDAKFTLLGEGPELMNLQEKCKEKKLESSVEFKGWVDRSVIPEFLSHASIGIGPLKLSPLTAKSIPIKVLEYMSSSLPIIAKKDSISDDILVDGENGYFIENTNELSERIIQLLQNPQLVEEMGNASRKKVEKFSWKNLLTPVLEKYQTRKNS